MKSNFKKLTIRRNYHGKMGGFMTGMRFSNLLFLAITIPAVFFSSFAMAADKGCEALRKDIELKRGQLAEYRVALDKCRDRGDPKLESLLKHKIDDLLAKINAAEEITDCTKVAAAANPEGTSPVKTDAGDYGTKSCAELRTMLVQLLRKTKSLKRRKYSTFSELTSAERTILQDSEKEIRIVTPILKNRCVQSVGPRSKKGVKKRKANP